jgi:hypothetical protein
MSRSKTYISTKWLNLSTEVEVNGVIRTIKFKGGIASPRRVNGSLTTTDPALQAAIEADPCFGKSWKLYKDWGEQAEVNKVPTTHAFKAAKPPPNSDNAHITGPVPEGPGVVIHPPVTEQAEEDKSEGETVSGPVPDPDVPDPAADPIVAPDVTSAQTAKAFLVNTFDDVKMSSLRNSEIIRNLAAERNVEFPQWPKV